MALAATPPPTLTFNYIPMSFRMKRSEVRNLLLLSLTVIKTGVPAGMGLAMTMGSLKR